MRQSLLTQAEKLARSRGYDGFSFADLADHAGIRKASVHHHFPTKAGLSTELMDLYADRVLASLAEADDQMAGARLKHITGIYRDALNNGRSVCLCVAFSALQDRLPEPTQNAALRFQNDVRAWLVRVFTDAQSDRTITGVTHPEAEAMATFALLEGAQITVRASKQISDFDTATATLLARVTSGEDT